MIDDDRRQCRQNGAESGPSQSRIRVTDSRLLCQVVTGSDLQGGGVFSFIKAKGTPQNRAIIASVFVAIGTLVANPSVVTALTADASINSDI